MTNEMVRYKVWDGDGGFLKQNCSYVASDADVDIALKALKGAELTTDGDDGLRFSGFPAAPMNIELANEKAMYTPLRDICNALRDLTLTDGRTATCQFRQNPDHYPQAETPGANFRMDASLRLVQSTIPSGAGTRSQHAVADLAAPSEYKIKNHPAEVLQVRVTDANIHTVSHFVSPFSGTSEPQTAT